MSSSKDYDRLEPGFALVAALDGIPVLQDPDGNPKVAALQPKKDWRAPFVFYIPDEDSEELALDGPTGLQSWSAAVHFVAGTYRGLQLLCQRAKRALFEMQGNIYRTSETETDDDPGVNGIILVETVNMEASSPDLVEMEVGYYRRVYTVRIDYQTEEVWHSED